MPKKLQKQRFDPPHSKELLIHAKTAANSRNLRDALLNWERTLELRGRRRLAARSDDELVSVARPDSGGPLQRLVRRRAHDPDLRLELCARHLGSPVALQSTGCLDRRRGLHRSTHEAWQQCATPVLRVSSGLVHSHEELGLACPSASRSLPDRCTRRCFGPPKAPGTPVVSRMLRSQASRWRAASSDV